jgi:hypothetical protein
MNSEPTQPAPPWSLHIRELAGMRVPFTRRRSGRGRTAWQNAFPEKEGECPGAV